MHNTPAVYIPTQPEGNGLTLPALLSLLVHGIVIGLLIYTYQPPELETVGSIETIMVSPGELAEMQGQILANRAAAQAQNNNSNSSSAPEQLETYSNSSANQYNMPSNSGSTRQNELTSQQIPMSEQQQLQAGERNSTESTAETGDMSLKEFDQIEYLNEERNTIKETQNNSSPKIKPPNSTQRNIEIDLGSSGHSGKSFDLADNNQASASSSSSSSNRGGGASRGISNSEIVKRIKDNYNPPTAAKGTTQRTTLTITVDANGNVVNVSAAGADSAVNEAAKQAVLNTRNLPIDTDDPKYPTFTLQFNGSN